MWAGTLDLGLALARGNARTDTLTTNFAASRATNTTKTTVHFNQLYGTARLYKLSGVTTVTQSLGVFPNLSSGGDYRANFDLTAVTTLRKWLGWQVSASDRFLTNPVLGRQRNDLLLSTGLRVSFAR